MRKTLYLSLAMLGLVHINIAYGTSTEGKTPSLLLPRGSTGSVKLPSISGRVKWSSLSTRRGIGRGMQQLLSQRDSTEVGAERSLSGESESRSFSQSGTPVSRTISPSSSELDSGFVSWTPSAGSTPMIRPVLTLNDICEEAVDDGLDLGIIAQDQTKILFEEDISQVRMHISEQVQHSLECLDGISKQSDEKRMRLLLLNLAVQVRSTYFYTGKQMEGRTELLQGVSVRAKIASEFIAGILHEESLEKMQESLDLLRTDIQEIGNYVERREISQQLETGIASLNR